MTDTANEVVVDFTDENPGKIEIIIGTRLGIKSNLSPEAMNLWIDRAKNMIVTGDVEVVEGE